MKRRTCGWLVVVGWLVSTTATAADRGDVYDLVPDNAWGLVVIHQPTVLQAKAAHWMETLGESLPDPFEVFQEATGIGTGAIDKQRTFALAALPPAAKDAQPIPLLLLPVTDYATFLAHFEPKDASAKIVEVEVNQQHLVVCEKNAYALLTLAQHRAALESVLNSTTSLRPGIKSLHSFVNEQDACVIITREGLANGADILLKDLEQAFKELMSSGMLGMGITASSESESDEIGKTIQSAKKQVIQAALGVRIDKKGDITVNAFATFIPDSEWAKDAARQPPAGNVLTNLEAGPYFLAMGSTGLSSITDAVHDFGLGFFKQQGGTELTDQQLESIRNYQKALGPIHSFSMLYGLGEANDGMFSRFVSFMQVDDAVGYLEGMEKASSGLTKLFTESDNVLLKNMKLDPTTIGDTKVMATVFDVTSIMKAQAGGAGPEAQVQRMMVEKVLGPGGKFTEYYAALKPKTVAITLDKGMMEELIKYKNEPPESTVYLVDDELVKETLTLLPQGNQFVALLAPAGYMRIMKNMMAGVANAMGGQMPMFQFPDFPDTPPFAVSSKATAAGWEGHVVIPMNTVSGIVQYFKNLMNAFQGLAA